MSTHTYEVFGRDGVPTYRTRFAAVAKVVARMRGEDWDETGAGWVDGGHLAIVRDMRAGALAELRALSGPYSGARARELMAEVRRYDAELGEDNNSADQC